MKYTILIVVLFISAKTAFTQYRNPEFKRYANGLIYNDTVFSRLKRIADTRHAQYKKSTQTRTYYSVPQTIGQYITCNIDNAKEAIADMHNNISLEDLVKKYPQTIIDSNVLIVLLKRGKKELIYTLYPNSDMENSFTRIGLDTDSADVMHKTSDGVIGGRTGNWVYSWWEDGKKYGHNLRAFYLSTPLKTVALPEKYAAWVRYADCLIDTTTSTFLPGAKDGFSYYYDGNKAGPKYEALRKDVDDRKRDSAISYIEKQFRTKPAFKKMFFEAVKEALQLKYPTSNWFETAVEKHYSKQAALTLKRNRHTWDRCGADFFRWPHIFDITQLAAETANWPVFINAHLDLINHRPLHSIELYYEVRPYTLTNELELLGVNVYDLLMGICLNISDAAPNHYSANLEYIYRAIRELKFRDRIEQELISMMADSELDDFNRLRMHYLLLNCLHYTQGNDELRVRYERLQDADKKLPYYISSRLWTNKNASLNLINPD
jgi:hypothetical protein